LVRVGGGSTSGRPTGSGNASRCCRLWSRTWIEELVELAHTSIRQYQRPNGEVIAPSKTNRERVIPMSAELVHVIAMIVLRQTAHGPIPLVPRYDGHERVWTAPMPYLFSARSAECGG